MERNEGMGVVIYFLLMAELVLFIISFLLLLLFYSGRVNFIPSCLFLSWGRALNI